MRIAYIILAIIVIVNKRRKSVGLVPIEEIAKEKGFIFNINEDE